MVKRYPGTCRTDRCRWAASCPLAAPSTGNIPTTKPPETISRMTRWFQRARSNSPISPGQAIRTRESGDRAAAPRPPDVVSIVPCAPASHFQQKATMAPDIPFIRHIDLHLLFSRARERNTSRASVALAESARRGVLRPTVRRKWRSRRARKSEPAGALPVAAARGFRRLNDGSRRIGAIALPSMTEPGVSAPGPAADPGTSSRWTPGSTSSKSPESPGFEPRCHGPGGPFSYEGRKNGGKNQRSVSRRRPGRCRSLEVLPRGHGRGGGREWTNLLR
jgi:hypothetical protein